MDSNSNKKYKDTIGVLTARNRFWQKIKGINAAQNGYSQDEIFDNLFDESQMNYQSGRDSRKESVESGSFNDYPVQKRPFIVKFFERSMNLAYFDETTPMYPMCRAWLKSDVSTVAPINESDQSEVPDKNSEEEPEMDRLPPPYVRELGENRSPMCPRIPNSQPLQSDIAWEINSAGHLAPSPAIIFQEHLQKWIAVRQRWKKAAGLKEKRYAQSFLVLEQLFNKE